MPENCAAIVIAAKHHELIKVKDTRGTTHTVGALRCKFEFRTPDWLNSAQTAMFCNGNAILHPEVIDSAIAVPLDPDDECAVPYEVLTDTLPYSIGVWGVTKSGLRIVSKWLVFNAQQGCYTEGNAPADPDPTVYEQILRISQDAVNAANDVVERANNGEFNGEDGYTPIKNVDYFDGKDGVSVSSVVQTVESADDGGKNVVEVKLSDGSSFEFTVKNGNKGSDGRTPVLGEDYFTESEKDEFVASIWDELPDNIATKDDIPEIVQSDLAQNDPAADDYVKGKEEVIFRPESAAVGQTIVVKSVDSEGRPVKWEAVDFPIGGGSSVQSDWNQTDETQLDYIKNKPDVITPDMILAIMGEANLAVPIADVDDSILMTSDNKILLI